MQQAQLIGIKGWVRNRRDGSVEVEAWGQEAAVERLIERCGQGPSNAHVDRVERRGDRGRAADGLSGGADL